MKAYHYQAEDQRRTGCGRVGASFHTHIFADVDCLVCRKSVTYNLAHRRSQCGAMHHEHPRGARCTQPKGHEGSHYYV